MSRSRLDAMAVKGAVESFFGVKKNSYSSCDTRAHKRQEGTCIAKGRELWTSNISACKAPTENLGDMFYKDSSDERFQDAVC